MEELRELLARDPELWVSALPSYQREVILTFLEREESSEEAAKLWLTAVGPSHTFPYGGKKPEAIFYEKIVDEVEAFLCGGEAYDTEREQFLSEFDTRQAYVIGVISTSIAPVVGAAAAIIAPAIALVLMTTGKMGLRAWCGMRAELRKGQDQDENDP